MLNHRIELCNLASLGAVHCEVDEPAYGPDVSSPGRNDHAGPESYHEEQMPSEEEHEQPENMVEESTSLEEQAARSLPEMVDSHGTLQGYYAMNQTPPSPEAEKQLEEGIQKGKDQG